LFKSEVRGEKKIGMVDRLQQRNHLGLSGVVHVTFVCQGPLKLSGTAKGKPRREGNLDDKANGKNR